MKEVRDVFAGEENMNTPYLGFESNPPSRRRILKAGFLFLGGGALASCRSSAANGSSASDVESQIDLRIAGYPFDRVQGLVNGKVAIEGYSARFQRAVLYSIRLSLLDSRTMPSQFR